MIKSTVPSLTSHAVSRCAVRSISLGVASLLLRHGDVSLHAGDGCETLCLSRHAASMLLAEGMAPDIVARARRVAAVLGKKGVVTLLRPQGRAGRRYRRQYPTRAKQGI